MKYVETCMFHVQSFQQGRPMLTTDQDYVLQFHSKLDDIQGYVPLYVTSFARLSLTLVTNIGVSINGLFIYFCSFLLSPTVQASDPELNDASTYFDLGPRMVTQRGTYYYMCTRNNDFSNRSQKGKIIVQDNPLSLARVGSAGGTVELNG